MKMLRSIVVVLALLLLELPIVSQFGSDLAGSSLAADAEDRWFTWASVAWRFFQPSIGLDSQTGLSYAGSQYPYFTLWDTGTYLFAVMDAEKLGLIGRSGTWGFSSRVDKLLSFLETMPLAANNLPYLWYSASDGRPAFGDQTTNHSDLAQLLIALHNLRTYRPEYSGRVQSIANRINLSLHSVSGIEWDPIHTYVLQGSPATYSWTASSVGAHFFRAAWEGDAYYESSVSLIVEAKVEKASGLIEMVLGVGKITYGEAAAITLRVSPPSASGMASVSFIKERGVWTEALKLKTTSGRVEATWRPPEAGKYLLKGIWRGDENTHSAETTTQSLEVLKAASKTTLTVSPTSLNYGEDVSISLVLSPSVSTGAVAVQVSVQDGEWSTLLERKPSEGRVRAQWMPMSAASVRIRAEWSGDENYLSSLSEAVTLVVSKARSVVELELGRDAVVYGEAVRFELRVLPASVTGVARFLYSSDGGSTWGGAVLGVTGQREPTGGEES